MSDSLSSEDLESIKGISEHSNEYWDRDFRGVASALLSKNRKMYIKSTSNFDGKELDAVN